MCSATARCILRQIRDADDGSFKNVRLLVKESFYLGWGDLKTFVFDEFLSLC